MGLIRSAVRLALALFLVSCGYCAAVWLQWEIHVAHNVHTQHNQVIPFPDGAITCPVDEHSEGWSFNAYPAQRPQTFDLFNVREGAPK